jgi:hypothetical protein
MGTLTAVGARMVMLAAVTGDYGSGSDSGSVKLELWQ